MWWTAWLTGKMPSLPTSPSNYYLLSPPTARIKYGVDHTTYMHTLASDFGGSPALSELWRTHGLFVTFVYCFSAAFTSHYRLLGPFKSDKAPEVVKTEIWETVTRRGLLGNLYVLRRREPGSLSLSGDRSTDFLNAQLEQFHGSDPDALLRACERMRLARRDDLDRVRKTRCDRLVPTCGQRSWRRHAVAGGGDVDSEPGQKDQHATVVVAEFCLD